MKNKKLNFAFILFFAKLIILFPIFPNFNFPIWDDKGFEICTFYKGEKLKLEMCSLIINYQVKLDCVV